MVSELNIILVDLFATSSSKVGRFDSCIYPGVAVQLRYTYVLGCECVRFRISLRLCRMSFIFLFPQFLSWKSLYISLEVKDAAQHKSYHVFLSLRVRSTGF